MKKLLLIFGLVATVALVSAVPAWAHHGYAAYDETKLLTLKGTVTDYELENPHSTMSFDVKDKNGKIESWVGEAGHIRLMLANGWTRTTLKPGDVVTFYFHPAKDGVRSVDLVKITIPGGQTLWCHSSGLKSTAQ